jgi:MFS family permease
MATTNTLLQTLAPGHLRGRVMSLHTTLFLGVFPLSGLVWGALADRLGEGAVMAAGGLLVIAGSLVSGRGVLRQTPPALAAASAATRSDRSAATPANEAAPGVAATGVPKTSSR